MPISLHLCRPGHLSLIAGLCLLLSGCGNPNVTKANYDKISEGMTVEEVKEILGEPDDTFYVSEGPTRRGTGGSLLTMEWSGPDKAIAIYFSGERVKEIRQIGLE